MKHIFIFLTLCLTNFTHTGELTKFEKAKKISSELIAPGIFLGALTFCAGECAKTCPDPVNAGYSSSSIAGIFAESFDQSMYPYIQTCAEYAPYAGIACIVTPLACASALRTYQCCIEGDCDDSDDDNWERKKK